MIGRIAIAAAAFALACGSPRKDPSPAPTPTPVGETADAGSGSVAVAPPDAAPPPMPAPAPWANSGIDWSKPPPPGPVPTFTVPKPIRKRLRNGMTVVIVPNKRLPLVSLRVINKAGGSIGDKKRPGLAAITADMLDEGAGKRDALALARHVEGLGAKLSVYADLELSTLTMSTLSSTLPASLAVVTDVLSKPRLQKADFERLKRNRLNRIRRRRDRPRAVAGLIFDKVLYGAHPYGAPIAGTAQSVGKIQLAHVKRFYQRYYAPRSMAIVVTGDVQVPALMRTLGKTLGKWRRRGRRAPRTPRVSRTKRPRVVVVNRAGATQSAVRIGRLGITQKSREYIAATVINHALGGSFASRLNNRLREQLGYTYGAFSRHWHGRRSGTWYVASAIKTANTVDGIREALKLIASVVDQQLPAAELDKAKRMLVRQLPQRFETNGGTGDSFAELITDGLRLDHFAKLSKRFEAVTAAEAHSYAKANWKPDQLLIVIVGDLSKILPGLETLGLGPILEVNPEGAMVRTHGD